MSTSLPFMARRGPITFQPTMSLGDLHENVMTTGDTAKNTGHGAEPLQQTGYYSIYRSNYGVWDRTPDRHVGEVYGKKDATDLVETLNRRSGAEWDDEDQEYTGEHYYARPIHIKPETPDAIAEAEGLHPGMDDERLTNWRKITVYDLQEPLQGAMPPPDTPTVTLHQADCVRCGDPCAAMYWEAVLNWIAAHVNDPACFQHPRRNQE